MRSFAAAAVLALVLGAVPGSLRADDAAEIRALIPAASAIAIDDWERVATLAALPKASDFEEKSLTLMFMTFPAADDEKARAQFRFLGESGRVPKPSELAMEANRHVRWFGKVRLQLGPVTFIQADRITDMSCEVEGDTATGTVSFEVPKLYAGKVDYVAKRTEGKWKITELLMPGHGVHIVRGESGTWLQKPEGSTEEGSRDSEGD